MEKLSKIARVLGKIIKVLRGICIGCGIACAVMLIIGIFLPDHLYSNFVSVGDMSINLGNVELQLSRALEPCGSLRLYACVNLVSAMITLALSAIGLHLLYKILAPMAEARPFDSAVSCNLRKLGWVTLIGAVASSILDTLASMSEIGLFNLSELFAPSLVTGYTVGYYMDISQLLIPALLFLLSYVFRYGEELQQLSDETL